VLFSVQKVDLYILSMIPFSDPEKLRELIPPNIQGTDLMLLVHDLLQTAREDIGSKLERVEQLTNPDTLYADEDEEIRLGKTHHDTFVISQMADSFSKLEYDWNTLEEVIQIASILYTWKGTAKCLQTILDLFEIPLNVHDSAEVNLDPSAFSMTRDLECELLFLEQPGATPTDADYDKVKSALDTFMWVCVKPIFLIINPITDNIELTDTVTLTLEDV